MNQLPITYQDIYGGYTTKGDASGNTIRLEGTLSGSGAEAQTNVFVKSRFLKQSAYVTGGETWGGSANGNKVSLENIGINDNVIGGYTENMYRTIGGPTSVPMETAYI